MANIQSIVWDSLMNIWRDFIARTPYLVGALFILIITWLVAKGATKVVRSSMRKMRKRDSLVQLMERLVKAVIWIAGLIAAAMIVFPGLTPSKALGAAGLASVAIGLAFKDIFQNFFAGIMLLWKFPFEEGDVIECGDIKGRIKHIELRHCQIIDTSGELIIIPNSIMVTQPVEVLTYQKHRRVEFQVGVSYDTDVPYAKSVIEEAMSELTLTETGKPMEILATEFGDSSINFDILIWAGSQPMQQRKAKNEAIIAIKKALDETGIEIPFPYRTLTFKEPLNVASMNEQ